MKASQSWRPDHLKTLKKYLGQATQAKLVYRGESMPEADGLQVINYSEFLLSKAGA
jgi:hypothetical protein